jgi:hypothetical protein
VSDFFEFCGDVLSDIFICSNWADLTLRGAVRTLLVLAALGLGVAAVFSGLRQGGWMWAAYAGTAALCFSASIAMKK